MSFHFPGNASLQDVGLDCVEIDYSFLDRINRLSFVFVTNVQDHVLYKRFLERFYFVIF